MDTPTTNGVPTSQHSRSLGWIGGTAGALCVLWVFGFDVWIGVRDGKHGVLALLGLNWQFVRSIGDISIPLLFIFLLGCTAMRLPRCRWRNAMLWCCVAGWIFVLLWWSWLRLIVSAHLGPLIGG